MTPVVRNSACVGSQLVSWMTTVRSVCLFRGDANTTGATYLDSSISVRFGDLDVDRRVQCMHVSLTMPRCGAGVNHSVYCVALYTACAAVPCSATLCISTVRIWISTGCTPTMTVV